jgi:hypothetical protein
LKPGRADLKYDIRKAMPALKQPSPQKLRAWYSRQQGLDGTLHGKSAAEVLERTGWARSVGGVGPYLTLQSRAGVTREAADRAIALLEIHELPAARNCTYVLPAVHFALGLTVGSSFWGGDWKVAEKLGVTGKELDKLCAAVLRSLEKGPLEPDEIRTTVGSAARSLGEEGKKKGQSTTLPLALGKLQTLGEIRRLSTNGRLDQQRYKYALWRPNPLDKFKLSQEEAMAELASLFYRWIAPASLAEFQAFSALGVKAAKAATDGLGLVPFAPGDDRLMTPEQREQYDAFQVPRDPAYSLVGAIDGICLLRRDLKTLLDQADQARELFVEHGTKPGGSLKDLPSHGIFDRGRLVGLWEYDPASGSIAWMSFVKRNKDLEKAVAGMEDFVRTQLGDARSFSLDSPKSRAPRIEFLRRS